MASQRELSKCEKNVKVGKGNVFCSFVPHSAQHTVQGQKVNIYLMSNLKTGQ